LKITGLDKLSKQLNYAERTLKGLDGELGSITFDPHDPGTIEIAIKRMESMIDERVGISASNPIVAPLVNGMKEQYRSAILERATEARLTNAGE
jgi:hypothetical protein